MNNMKRFTALLAAVVALAWAAPAAELEGVLMDKMCSAKALQEVRSPSALR